MFLLIRMFQTPPRVITLDDHYFPSAAEDYYDKENEANNEMNAFNDMNTYQNTDNSQANFGLDQSMNTRDFSTVAWK